MLLRKLSWIKGKLKLPDPSTVNAKPQADAVAALLEDLKGNEKYEDWQKCVRNRLKSALLSERAVVFNEYYAQIGDVLLLGATVDCSQSAAPKATLESGATRSVEGKKLFNALQAYVAAAELTQANFDAEVIKATSAPLLSLEYDFNTPQNQPSNSAIKVVGSFSWPTPPQTKAGSNSTAPWTLTYNVGASLYNSTPSSNIPGASSLRDVQAGLQLDRNIASSKWPGILGKIGDTTVSATYYYQYQSSPSILNVTPGSPLNGITITGLPSTATQVFTQKGNISVAQLKYGFGKGTNLSFPIAVTYSNRTELIAHPTWGLQFGVSYDLSALMGAGSAPKK